MYRRNRGPLAAALTKVYPNQQPNIIVRSLAEAVLSETKIKCQGPPFDPFQCARALGVQISYESIEAEAVFCTDKISQPKIIIKKPGGKVTAAYWRRMNFTLAHELGHFIIRKTLAGFFPASRFSASDSEEEFLCNLFAEELLMPSAILAADLRSVEVNPDSLIDLSHRYDVSLRCLLCRTTRFARGRLASAIWNNRNGTYNASWTSPNTFRGIVLCDTGHTTVERAFSSNKSEFGRDDLMLDGKRMKWAAGSKLLKGSMEVLTVMSRQTRSPYRFLPTPRPSSNEIVNLAKIFGPTQPLLPFRN